MEHVVISDIDGTITQSDVLGHVIPAIGGTWAHAGVTELFNKIQSNGYRLIYLSTRTIGMSYLTKKYLESVMQDAIKLPDGPVFLSPTSVLIALQEEYWYKKPEEFKIACLKDLKNLFPTRQPFFAAFGNRNTDIIAYQAVNIPKEKIYIIDPNDNITRSDGFQIASAYSKMLNNSFDYMFPPIPNKIILINNQLIKPEDIFFTKFNDFFCEKNEYYTNLVNKEAIDYYNMRRKKI